MNMIDQNSDLLRASPAISVARIQRAVAEYYQLSVADLLSPTRTQEIALARHVAIYMASVITRKSYTVLGNHFGGRDHSTVSHAVSRIERLKNADSEISTTLDDLRRMLPSIEKRSTDAMFEAMAERARINRIARQKNPENTQADAIACVVAGPAIDIRDRLRDVFGEVVQIHATIRPGVKMELLLSATGTWTILEVDQKTMTASIIDRGTNWKRSSQSIPEFPGNKEKKS